MKWNPLERLFWPLFFTTLALSLVGVAMVYSAAAPDSSESFAIRQLAWIGVGLIAMFFILLIGYRNILNMSYVFYVFGILVLAGVLFLGHTRMGAQRWIALGPFVLQPSEFFKIILILTLAHYLGNSEKNLYQLMRFFMCFFITVIPLVLVLKQPDLGTALIFLPILFCLLFVWGARLRFFLITFTLGLSSLPFLWHMLKDYQKKRLLVFINPNMDPLGSGYTALQSKIAVGAGGLVGKGWMQGTQNKLDFLPEHHTDFIFGVVGEEFGFMGSCLLIGLFMVYVYYALRVIQSTTDTRAKLLATGVVVMLVFHILINIGMTIGLMPIAGLPLPFISYGGSAMITFYIATGLLLSIYRERSIF